MIINHTKEAMENEVKVITELIEKINIMPLTDDIDFITASRLTSELSRLKVIVKNEWEGR